MPLSICLKRVQMRAFVICGGRRAFLSRHARVRLPRSSLQLDTQVCSYYGRRPNGWRPNAHLARLQHGKHDAALLAAQLLDDGV